MIEQATLKLTRGESLSGAQAAEVMEEIMSGMAQTPAIVAFLKALSNKGETIEEITAAVSVMRRHATRIPAKNKVILDTCGTGADEKNTFNVSTAAAFVASACGIAVAKHGNRSVSSSCGSADILEALGVDINMPAEKLSRCLDEIGIAFLFAQNLHPAMKYAMAARKEIRSRTIFNILGPLTNPAGATHQLVGVYQQRWTDIIAAVLGNLGCAHALVVHSQDGLDELSTGVGTYVSEIRRNKLSSYLLEPEKLGFKKARLEDLKGGTASQNAGMLLDILKGKPGPKRDIVLLNSAAAIYVSDKVSSIEEGIKMAARAVDSGKAMEKLELLKKYSR